MDADREELLAALHRERWGPPDRLRREAMATVMRVSGRYLDGRGRVIPAMWTCAASRGTLVGECLCGRPTRAARIARRWLAVCRACGRVYRVNRSGS